jgi:hypothetical protein
MFEKACRMRLRWQHRGWVNAEDLWDLSVEALDTIYKQLAREAKASEEESLLVTRSDEDEVLALQIEIVKYVVKVKLEAKEAAKNAAANAAKKQKLLTVLQRKQDAALEEKDVEELQAMIDAL